MTTTVILALSGFELLYWHPAEDGCDGRLESAPVVAWSIDPLGRVTPTIGALYLGRSWLTIFPLPRLHRLLRHPMLWLLAGTFARLGLVLAAFLLAACLLGLVAAWFCLGRKARRPP